MYLFVADFVGKDRVGTKEELQERAFRMSDSMNKTIKKKIMDLYIGNEDDEDDSDLTMPLHASSTTGTGQGEVPRYTEQDVKNAVKEAANNAIRGLKRKISDTFQCSVCKGIPRGQIKQCRNGHLACSECMDNGNIKSCPVCRGPLGNKKNRAVGVEQLIEAVDLEFNCKHANCDFTATKQDLTIHEKKCEHREFICRHANCQFTVAKSYLPSHEKKCEHRIVECPDTECQLLVPFWGLLDHMENGRVTPTSNPCNWIWWMSAKKYTKKAMFAGWDCTVVKFQDKLFAATFCRIDRMYCAYVQIFGDPDEAKKFSAKISIGNKTKAAGLFGQGQVFPIDMKKCDIWEKKSELLCFSSDGMADSFFQDQDVPGQEKKIEVTYEIIKSSNK